MAPREDRGATWFKGDDTLNNIVEWAVGTTAVLAALAAVLQSIRWVVTHMLRFSHFLTTWTGQPAQDGMPEVPSVPAQLQHITDMLHEQRHTLEDHDRRLISLERVAR